MEALIFIGPVLIFVLVVGSIRVIFGYGFFIGSDHYGSGEGGEEGGGEGGE